MEVASCRNCRHAFPVTQARVLPGLDKEVMAATYRSLDEAVSRGSMVRCPKCGMESQSSAVRFFGVVSPRALKLFVGLLIAAMLAFVLYVLARSV
jgi:hypothetical protein